MVTATSVKRQHARRCRLLALILLLPGYASVADQSVPDQYIGSLLYAKPVEFIPNVWTATGATAPTTYENAGRLFEQMEFE